MSCSRVGGGVGGGRVCRTGRTYYATGWRRRSRPRLRLCFLVCYRQASHAFLTFAVQSRRACSYFDTSRPSTIDLEGAATTSVAVTCNGFIIIRLDVVERITSSARVGPGALRRRTRRVHRRPRHLCYDVGSSSVPTATSAAAAARARTTSARIWRGVELPVNLLAELSSRRGRVRRFSQPCRAAGILVSRPSARDRADRALSPFSHCTRDRQTLDIRRNRSRASEIFTELPSAR